MRYAKTTTNVARANIGVGHLDDALADLIRQRTSVNETPS